MPRRRPKPRPAEAEHLPSRASAEAETPASRAPLKPRHRPSAEPAAEAEAPAEAEPAVEAETPADAEPAAEVDTETADAADADSSRPRRSRRKPRTRRRRRRRTNCRDERCWQRRLNDIARSAPASGAGVASERDAMFRCALGVDGQVHLGPTAPGRGAWLCGPECVPAAISRRGVRSGVAEADPGSCD